MATSESGLRIAHAIFALLDQRRAGATVCPSEVARAIYPQASEWRAAMPEIREVAGELASRGLLSVTRQGEAVSATGGGGPIRLGRSAKDE